MSGNVLGEGNTWEQDAVPFCRRRESSGRQTGVGPFLRKGRQCWGHGRLVYRGPWESREGHPSQNQAAGKDFSEGISKTMPKGNSQDRLFQAETKKE